MVSFSSPYGGIVADDLLCSEWHSLQGLPTLVQSIGGGKCHPDTKHAGWLSFGPFYRERGVNLRHHSLSGRLPTSAQYFSQPCLSFRSHLAHTMESVNKPIHYRLFQIPNCIHLVITVALVQTVALIRVPYSFNWSDNAIL